MEILTNKTDVAFSEALDKMGDRNMDFEEAESKDKLIEEVRKQLASYIKTKSKSMDTEFWLQSNHE